MAPRSDSRYIESCRPFLIALTFLTTTERPQMSLDKLIIAATDYFTTGADVHRRALAGGGGKITDLSAPNNPPVGTVSDATIKTVTPKAKKPAAVEESFADLANAASKEAAKLDALVDKAPAEAKPSVAAHREFVAEGPQDDLDGPAISYEEDIRPVLRAKSLANRDALVALLGKFNVKSGQELTAEQYPAFLAGLKAI